MNSEIALPIPPIKHPSSTVMIHSSLLKFGIIENGVDGFLKCIIESLAGEPTIVMPAFTFSYFDNQYWYAKKTKSEERNELGAGGGLQFETPWYCYAKII